MPALWEEGKGKITEDCQMWAHEQSVGCWNCNDRLHADKCSQISGGGGTTRELLAQKKG